MMKLSTSKELEGLQNKKTGLEEESHSLKEEQQSLDERVKVLEEKIAIEELKNNNKATREAISQLESKIDELEQRLKETSKLPETRLADEIKPEVAKTPEPKEETTLGIAEATTDETEEDVVTVMPLEGAMATEQEEHSEDIKKQHGKKRKFF